MARPEKKRVDYFSHDADASINSTTITVLEEKYGNDGYAFWFKLLERLCLTENHVIDCNNYAVWEFLLSKTHITDDKARSMLDVLSNLQAIDSSLWANKIIWCQKLIDRITDVYTNRNKLPPLKPSYQDGKLIFGIVSTTDNPCLNGVTDCSNEQIKLNKIKLNKTKRNNTAKSFDINIYKLELAKDFPELDIDKEIKSCQTWWSEGKKKMSRPKTAYRNWMINAMKYRGNGNGKHIGNTETSHQQGTSKYNHLFQK